MYQNFFTAKHIMVDLETTGLDDTQDSIVEIGARQFNPFQPRTNKVSFEITMLPLLSRNQLNVGYWTEKPERAARLEKFKSATHAADVAFYLFNRWLDDMVIDLPSQELYMWAKPGHFEWGFLNKYYKELGLTNPIKYNRVIDLRSMCYSLFVPHFSWPATFAEEAMLPLLWMEKLDNILDSRNFKHHALSDVDDQIMMWAKALQLSKDHW